MDALRALFDSDDFPARWHCGHWTAAHGYVHIVSDLLVWGAYTAIPILMAFFFFRRKERLPFPRLGWLFVAFIFACGTTHLLDAVMFYQPMYRVSGLMKAVTAGVSWLAVAALVPALPRALAQPSSAQLSEALAARDRAEQSSRRHAHRFESAFREAPIGMALLDGDGICVDVNPTLCAALSRDRAALLGRAFRDLFLAADQAPPGGGIPAVCDGTLRHFKGRKRLQRDDDKTQWMEVSASAAHPDEPGALVVVHLIDVTEEVEAHAALRRLNEDLEALIAERTAELQRSNEELERFGYAAAHDLKAPLRALANLNQWIVEEEANGNPELVAEYRQLISSRITRMKNLVDDLLTYARAGRADSMVSAIDLRDIITTAIEQVRPPEGFTLDVSADLPTIEAARGPLTQIFANLIANAVKHHGSAAGRIAITAREAGDFWELSVADDGQGIPATQRERVFEMFQTLRPRDEIEGSGLGLSLVRRTVMVRGGRVSLDETPGGGCTVRVFWPKNPTRARGVSGAPPTDPGGLE
jgi:PAS domain S-box-containing protein